MNDKTRDSSAFQNQEQKGGQDAPPAEIDTRELLGKRREVTILHAGERYRLRVTSTNKLILTK